MTTDTYEPNHLFLNAFDRVCRQYHIPREPAEKIRSLWKIKIVPARTILFDRGAHFSQIWFVVSGAIKGCRLEKTQEWPYTLTVPNQYVTDFKSYISGQPSILTFESVTDVVYYYINKEDLDALYVTEPLANEYGRFLAEYCTNFIMSRIWDLQSKTLKERYEALKERFPDVVKLVSQQDIAAYIGAKPQSLSRLKKQYPE